MTKWKIEATAFDDREKDYSASFVCTNQDTKATVDVTIRQDKGRPANDLIGSLRAIALLFVKVQEESDDDSNTAQLH